jgi:hypothetical protein
MPSMLSPTGCPDIVRAPICVTPAGKVSRADAGKILHKTAKTLANYAVLGIGPKVTTIGGRAFYDYDECLAMARGEKPIKPQAVA